MAKKVKRQDETKGAAAAVRTLMDDVLLADEDGGNSRSSTRTFTRFEKKKKGAVEVQDQR
ncbi:hypothetical protein NECAME_01660 [Necator americanus]|uniref:Uncharacterized protein n=1 Tax=Necator americanus TaxID=51031 RepID=W2TRK5_NECAM|nr:hypothetical protein NECAME_01660 [Necator americanus]ETN84433.1 hypothetical protein NECAME_01660 [Necator americanus]